MNGFESSIVESLSKSKFTFNADKLLEITNAVIIFRNFSGQENRFGNSKPCFNVVVNEEVAKILKEKGILIHSYDDKDTGKPAFLFIHVNIGMGSPYPPIVTVYTDYNGTRTHNAIDKDTISSLDRITFESADCILAIYLSSKTPGKASAYLRKLNVIHKKVIEFGGKYDDWDRQIVVKSSDVKKDNKPGTEKAKEPDVVDGDWDKQMVDGDEAPKR